MVKVYPRQIDLDNIAKIKTYVDTHLVEDMQSLKISVNARSQAVITKKS
jgi:hypothetical protein